MLQLIQMVNTFFFVILELKYEYSVIFDTTSTPWSDKLTTPFVHVPQSPLPVQILPGSP
jgi:hypothetical protein